MGKEGIPVLDLSRCTDCGSCIEVCPEVFRRNLDTGLIEVLDWARYPKEQIREAIKVCPADCIELEQEAGEEKGRMSNVEVFARDRSAGRRGGRKNEEGMTNDE